MPQPRVCVLAADNPEESTTLAVKLKVPAVVGVPVRAPVEVLSVTPVGSEPAEIENVYGLRPPVAIRAEE